jgi:PAS domain S-box-containing protein
MALKLFNAHNQIKESEESIRHVFDYTSIGVSLLSLSGEFIKVNNVLCEKLEYQEEELLGKHFNDVTYPEDREIGKEYYRKILKNEIENIRFEKRYLSKKGKILWCLVSISLVRDYKNEPKLFITQISDISYLKQSEEIIKEKEEEINLALKIAKIGYWKFNCKNFEIKWYTDHLNLFGIKNEDFSGSYEDFLKLVHPEDRTICEEILKKTIKEKSIYEWRYRVVHPDGTIKKLHSYGKIYLDEKDKPDYIFGITQDLTDHF